MPKNRYCDTGGSPTHKKGREAEKLVAFYLGLLGHKDVRLNDKLKGPDVFLGKLTIEVKRAVRYIRHNKYIFWLTEKVSKRRLGDDFIAIVTPDNRILIESMNTHLKKCRKDGRRNITAFVKETA